MPSRTLVFQVRPDPDTIPTLEIQGREAARWMKRAFRRLYADKRNGGWRLYGPNTDQGKKYGKVVTTLTSGRYLVRGDALYPAFIKQGGKEIPHLKTWLPARERELLAENVAVTWGNFLNADLPRGRLPRWRPLVALRVDIGHLQWLDDGLIIQKGAYRFEFVRARNVRYFRRLALLRRGLQKKTWTKVEIRQHNDSHWYAHIPISIDAPHPPRKRQQIMGIDLGIRNIVAAAIITSETAMPSVSTRVPGGNLQHRLDRVYGRIRGLQRKKDRGSRSAANKLIQLKGKRTRQQHALVHDVVARMTKLAIAHHVDGIVIEDLSKMPRMRKSRSLNRRVMRWARGDARKIFEEKAEEAGLAIVAVYPRGTSSECPACGAKGGRNITIHKYICYNCGLVMNDDEAAAINIARRGWKYWNSTKGKAFQSKPCVAQTGGDIVVVRKDYRDREDCTPPKAHDDGEAITRKGVTIGSPMPIANGTALRPPPPVDGRGAQPHMTQILSKMKCETAGWPSGECKRHACTSVQNTVSGESIEWPL